MFPRKDDLLGEGFSTYLLTKDSDTAKILALEKSGQNNLIIPIVGQLVAGVEERLRCGKALRRVTGCAMRTPNSCELWV